MTLRAELIEELDRCRIAAPHATSTLLHLRVPDGCPHLSSVANACNPALVSLCDYHDTPDLLQAREVVQAILICLRINAHLSDDTQPTIDAVPREAADPAYRALALQMENEPWWRITLREALLTLMLRLPGASGIDCLAAALRSGLPVSHDLPVHQRSPAVRIELLGKYLAALNAPSAHRSVCNALHDTLAMLRDLPAVRTEALHPDNDALIAAVASEHTRTPVLPSAREKLHRLARDIGVTAVGQRRAFHAPAEQVLMHAEAVHALLRRAPRWDADVRTALHGCLLLGRIGQQLLKDNNGADHLHLKHHLHEVWIERTLAPERQFPPAQHGRGYEVVTRQLRLPLPRELGTDLFQICIRQAGPAALRALAAQLRLVGRESGHRMSLRRLTRWFEHSLENDTPDEALMVLLGIQPRASRDAAAHYFAPSTTILVQRFRHTVEHLVDQYNVDIATGGWSAPPPLEAGYVGYSYRPSIDGIRSLVEHLRAQATLGRGRASSERLREAHNARVALLTVMYLAATGARPNRTVLPLWSELLSTDRTVLVSEKDSLDYRSTRLVPLTARLLEEIATFTSWRASKNLGPRQCASDLPVAMLLDQAGTLHPPTLEALRAHAPGFRERWHWPDDALRHHFRSWLWDKGCPTGWLRRVMGHYPKHAAADVPYATTPLWAGLHDWNPLIDELLTTLGF